MSRLIKNKLLEASNSRQERAFVNEIRHNIKCLNRSMQSIEKMIQKSRDLLISNKDNLKASKEGSKIKIRSNSSQRSKDKYNNPLLNTGTIEGKLIQPQQKQNEKLCPNCKKSQINDKAKGQFRFISKNSTHQKHSHSEQPLKQKIYQFSPQRTKKASLSHTRNSSVFNPEKRSKFIIKPAHNHTSSMESQVANSNERIFGKIKLNSSSKKLQFDPKAKNTQCKTEYKAQDSILATQGDINKSFETNNKKQISIKLFSKKSSKKKTENIQFQQIINSQNFKVQPPYLLKIKQMLKNERSQHRSQTTEQTKAKFIEKVSQYKFVENYLNKNEIWQIYDKIISDNIPQLKWPIVLVDSVYKKIHSSQQYQM